MIIKLLIIARKQKNLNKNKNRPAATERKNETILNDARYNFPKQEYYIIPASVLAIGVIFLLSFIRRMIFMSVIKREYTSKKTGKTKRTYIACEWHPLLQKKVYGDAFTNRKNAKSDNVRLIAQIKREIEQKEQQKKKSSKMLFDIVADKWFRATKASYADETYKTYKSYYMRYLKPIFGDSEITEIESSHILYFIKITLLRSKTPIWPKTGRLFFVCYY